MRSNHVWMTIVMGAVLLGLSSFAWGAEFGKEYKPVTGETPTYTEGLPGGILVESLIVEFNDMQKGFRGQVESRVYRDAYNMCTFAYIIRRQDTGSSGQHLIRVGFRDEDSTPWKTVTIVECGADGSGHSTAGQQAPSWDNGDPRYIARDNEGVTNAPVFRWRNNNDGTSIDAGDTSSMIWLRTLSKGSKRGGLELGDQGALKVDVLVPDVDAVCEGNCKWLCSSAEDGWGRIADVAADVWRSWEAPGWPVQHRVDWLETDRWRNRIAAWLVSGCWLA